MNLNRRMIKFLFYFHYRSSFNFLPILYHVQSENDMLKWLMRNGLGSLINISVISYTIHYLFKQLE